MKLSSNASQQIEHLLKKFPLNIKERQELQPRTERSTVSFDSGWSFCCLYCLKSSMLNAYTDVLWITPGGSWWLYSGDIVMGWYWHRWQNFVDFLDESILLVREFFSTLFSIFFFLVFFSFSQRQRQGSLFHPNNWDFIVTEWVFHSLIYGQNLKHMGHNSKGKKQGFVTYSIDQEDKVGKIFLISSVCWTASSRSFQVMQNSF